MMIGSLQLSTYIVGALVLSLFVQTLNAFQFRSRSSISSYNTISEYKPSYAYNNGISYSKPTSGSSGSSGLLYSRLIKPTSKSTTLFLQKERELVTDTATPDTNEGKLLRLGLGLGLGLCI